MKALVLAGGAGSRLQPISYACPKQLMPVADRPVISYGLEALRAAGVVDVGMIVGDPATELRDYVGSGSDFGLHVTYLPQEAPLGLAHCVRIAADFLNDDDFVLYLGDNLVTDGVSRVLDEYRARRPAALLTVSHVPNPVEYGVVELDETGRVTALEEKPSAPHSDLAVAGIYVFSPAIHQAVQGIEPSRRGELEITDAIQWLVDHGADVEGHLLQGYWKDIGRIEDLLDANRVLMSRLEPAISGRVDRASRLSGRVVIGDGAEVVRSRVTGPAIIGAGSRISDSRIGPFTAIGPDCRIGRAGVERSVVLAGAAVSQIRVIRDSVIGRCADVRSARSRSHQVIIADRSRVLIEG